MALKAKNRNNRSPKRPTRLGKNASRSEKAQISVKSTITSSRFLIITGSVLGLILLIAGAIIWYGKIYSDPERVFWGMIDNNLATQGVTKEIDQSTPTGSSSRLTQITWNPNPRVKSLREVTYLNTKPPTTVALEGVTTPTASYQHYSKVDDGKGKDYSQIYALWLQTQGGDANQSAANFNDAIFNVILVGNLRYADRHPITQKLHQAYEIDFSSIGKHKVDGRKVYTYDVKLNLQRYAEAAKKYAEFYGLPSAKFINPSNYSTAQRVPLLITVDVLSHQIDSILYEQAKTNEIYSAYGVTPQAEIPKNTVSAQVFQQAIQQLSQ